MILTQGLFCLFHDGGVLLDLVDVAHVAAGIHIVFVGAIVFGIVAAPPCHHLGQVFGGIRRAQFLQEPATPRIDLIDDVFGNQRLGLAMVRREVFRLSFVHEVSEFDVSDVIVGTRASS